MLSKHAVEKLKKRTSLTESALEKLLNKGGFIYLSEGNYAGKLYKYILVYSFWDYECSILVVSQTYKVVTVWRIWKHLPRCLKGKITRESKEEARICALDSWYGPRKTGAKKTS